MVNRQPMALRRDRRPTDSDSAAHPAAGAGCSAGAKLKLACFGIVGAQGRLHAPVDLH